MSSTSAVVFCLILVFSVINIPSDRVEGSGSAGIAQNRNLQDGAGDVRWWQGLSGAFMFLIPVLYTALQVFPQGKSESPFVTHQTNMRISIIAACFFFFTFATTNKAIAHNTTYFIVVIDHIAFFSGALSSLSILSIILPFEHALIFYVIWSLALAFSISCHFNLHTNWTKSLCHKLWSYFVKSLCDKFNKLWSCFVKLFRDKFKKLWSYFIKSLCDKFKKLWSYFVKLFRDKFNKLRGGGDKATDTTLSPQHPIDDLV